MKKLISLFVTAAICFSLIPCVAFAEESVTFTAIDGVQDGSKEGYAKLIDGSKTTKWSKNNFSGAYIVIEASAKIDVNGYVLTTGNDNASYKGRNPKSWTLYGCNDYDASQKTGTWTEIDKILDDTVLEDKNYTEYRYSIENNKKAYKYYKFEITAVKDGTFMQLAEMAFLYSVVHNVTFDENYENANTAEIEWRGELPINPVRDGYKFIGWYTESGDEFTADAEVNADMTVYAKWERVYTVTFDKNGGDTEAYPSAAEHGGDLPAPPTRAGYKFGGWYTKNGENGDLGTPYTQYMQLSADITVYARWLTTSVTFDKNGGDEDAVPSVLGAGEGLPETDPIKYGYKFIGWYTESDDEFTAGTVINDDVTVYAKWEKVTVTFDANGGEHQSDITDFLYGEGVPETNPDKKGFVFGGWYTKNGTADGEWGEEYGENSKFTDDTTVYAKWSVAGYDCSADIVLTAIAGTSGNSGESYDKVADGKKTPGNNFSKWCVGGFNGAYVILKASAYTVVTQYTLTTGNDNAAHNGRNPKDWILYASNDYDEETGTGTWTELHKVENDTVMEDKDYTSYNFEIVNTKAYKYYKLDIAAIHSGTTMQLAELELKCNGCEHAWGEPVTSTNATCTEDACDTYVCGKCALIYKAVIFAAGGHELGDDGHCTQCGKLFGVKVGDKYYYDLQTAFDEAEGNIVELGADTEISETVNITGAVTLDLKGYTFKMTGDGSVISVSGGAVFTLKDTSEAETGKITGGKAVSGGGVYNRGTFNMEGGTITGCSATSGNGGGIYSMSDSDYAAEVNITGGSVSGNISANTGGGIYIGKTGSASKKSALNISNAKIKNNVAEHLTNTYNAVGGGISVNMYAEVVIENTIIEGNSAYKGGGVAVRKYSTIKISGGKITDNSSNGGEGGGLYMENNVSAEIDGTEISKNKVVGCTNSAGALMIIGNSEADLKNVNISENVSGYGGAIYVLNSKVTVTGGKISNNESKTSSEKGSGAGGGIYVNYSSTSSYKNNAEVIIDGTELSGNKSQKDGGAVYAANANSSVKIKNATIKGNTAGTNGGGVYVLNNASAEISNTTAESNVSSKSGGAVYSNSANVTIAGGIFSANKAAEAGNAAALIKSTAEIKDDTVMDGNGETGSNVNGGGLYVSDSTVTVSSAKIRNNYAKNGGGMYLDSNTSMTIDGGLVRVLGNTADTAGGGVWCNTDKLTLNGAAEIRMNKIGDTENSNLYLVGGNTLNVQKVKAEIDGKEVPSLMSVSVGEGYKNVISANDTDYSGVIGSDAAGYGLRYDSTDKIVKLEEKYTVTFVFPGENREYQYFADETVNEYMVKAFSEEMAKTKTDAVFGGWFDGGAAYDFSKPVTKSATLEPKWLDAAKPGLSLTFDKYYVSNGTGILYLAAYSGTRFTGAAIKSVSGAANGDVADFGLDTDGADCIKLFMWNNGEPTCEAAALRIKQD